MLKLTFYGGVKEIGGTKILLEGGDTRLFLDFGTSYKRRGQFFEEYMTPRPGAGLLDFLETGLLPPLRGIYRPDLEATALGDPWERYEHFDVGPVNGVLVSHAHLDHCGYISFLRRETPVYTSAATAFVLKAMQDSAPTDLEKEICYFGERRPKKNKESDSEGPYLEIAKGLRTQRTFRLVESEPLSLDAEGFWNRLHLKSGSPSKASVDVFNGKIGSLEFKAFPVEHSIPGAYAFALETSAGWVGYTGDLRLQGGSTAHTSAAVEAFQRLRPTILICEGTRIGEPSGTSNVTEHEVRLNARRTLSRAQKLIIADFGPRNLERLLTFSQIAREIDRGLVILARDAYLLDAVSLVDSRFPSISSDAMSHVFIYEELKSTLAGWERWLWGEHKNKKVTFKEISAHPEHYILCFSFFDVNELVNIRPQGGLYVYSSSEAHDEEGRLDFKRLKSWIDHFGMATAGFPSEALEWRVSEDQRGFHASGHASGEELLQVVRQIAPKVLIPVHTEKPEAYVEALKGTGIEVRLPEMNGSMEF